MPLTTFDLVPKTIRAYKSEADWAAQTPNPAPRDPNKPTKLWADVSLTYGGPFTWNWGAFVNENVSYKFVAKDTAGFVRLTPIESMPAYESYGQNGMSILREHAYMFPQGVPFYERKSFTKDAALEINIAGNPALPPVDFPVSDGSYILIPTRDGKNVEFYPYEEFLAMAKPPKMTDEQRLVVVQGILNTAVMTPTAKIQAIRKAITNFGGEFILT